jgi:hypothetical protein
VIDLFIKTYDKLQMEKIAGIKMLIYKTEAYPAFVDHQGKNEYIPSRTISLYEVYAIAEFPELLQPLLIN